MARWQCCEAPSTISCTVILLSFCRLGAGWGDKKSICNKFAAGGAVTALCWARELAWGLDDGHVHTGDLATNKAYELFAHTGGSGVVRIGCRVGCHDYDAAQGGGLEGASPASRQAA